MNKIIKIISVIISFVMIFSVFAYPSVYASESILSDSEGDYCANTSDIVAQRNNITDILNDASIENCSYMYNLDGSPDFLYIQLSGDGYAIFLSQTLELMEYSPVGASEFSPESYDVYYCGPGCYFNKENDCFVDISSGERRYLTDEEISTYSNTIRQSLIKEDKAIINSRASNDLDSIISIIQEQILSAQKNYRNDPCGDVPSISDTSYITNLNIGSGTYIDNFMYFLSNPQHGNNSSGTCGAVAAQLLLSYHNYYSDRRIIANNYLNGNSTTEREKNPNYCSDPMSMTNYTLGTRGIEEDGSDDPNSYFSRIVDKIPASATTSTVKKGIKFFLDENDISYTIDSHVGGWFFGTLSVNTDEIIDEIDDGRPAIILMQNSLGGLDHYVVAYGYHDYTYPGTTDTYSGFITHFGWSSGYLNVWINSAWCYSYITLQINHDHNYNSYVGSFGTNGGVEYKCSTCGHRTDKIINIAANNRYTEKVVSLEPYTFKEYYLKFSVAGNKVIQTFGTKDTRLYLYDSNMNLLEQDDDDGYSTNALISYDFVADTTYILRVKFYSGSDSGDIRLAVVPTYHHDNYESAYGPYKLTTVSWSLSNDSVALFRYKFDSAGTVTFTMSSSTNTDTYLYVIDPASTSMMTKYTGSNPGASNLYDDDSGSGLQAMLTKTVQANKEYLVIISFYNPHTMSGSFSINTSN